MIARFHLLDSTCDSGNCQRGIVLDSALVRENYLRCFVASPRRNGLEIFSGGGVSFPAAGLQCMKRNSQTVSLRS